MKRPILPFVALTLMALLFGLSFVATKYALQSIPPFTLVFLRFFIALLLLEMIYLPSRGAKPGRREGWRVFLISLIVPGLYFLAETYGLKLSSATSISLLIGTIPIFASFFGFLILKERIGMGRGAGILISVFGVGIILTASAAGPSDWQIVQIGNLLGVGAAACAGLYAALGRHLLSRLSPLTLTTYQALSATILFLPLAGWEAFNHPWSGFSPSALLAVAYLGLFCSVLAFFLWNYGISRLEASRASVFNNLAPVFTVFGANFLLGERIHPGQIIGGVLVICGVTLAGAARKPH